MDLETRDWTEVRYDKRTHNQTLCSSSLALMHKNQVLIMTVAPTQNKDLGPFDISIRKNNLYVVALDTREMTHYHVEVPQLVVPFDYDGTRVLLLEYLPGAKKRMHTYDFRSRTLEVIYQVPHKVEFISHGRLVRNILVFVENHRSVKVYDQITKKETFLFKSDYQIVALDVNDLEELFQDDKEKQKISYDIPTSKAQSVDEESKVIN